MQKVANNPSQTVLRLGWGVVEQTVQARACGQEMDGNTLTETRHETILGLDGMCEEN